MEIKLDSSILDAINQNYKIDPQVLIEIEERRQKSEAATSSINEILNNAPTAPSEPQKSENITDEIINNTNYERTLKSREIKSISDLITLADSTIDRTTKLIQKIDDKIVPLVDEINGRITQIKNEYDTRISVGCRSNLIWKSIGTSTGYSPGVGSGITFSNYIVIQNPQDEIVKNYYGLKYYQKPSNRDYGFNIVSEFNGSISVGSQSLTVIGSGVTTGIQIGDVITDNLNTPSAFTVGNLPKVVGFGTTSVIGIHTTILGNVSLGSSIIAYTGIGSTGPISIGDYSINETAFDSSTRVVGFGTTTTNISYYDVGTATTVTVSVVVSSIILNKGSISSITNDSIGFGTYSNYDSILLDVPSNLTLEQKPFTVIRQTQDYNQNFNYANNPLDPVTIGIIDNSTIGVGHQVQIINNGDPSGPTQWRKVLGEAEPNVGAGYVKYYNGRRLWPYVSGIGYAVEGRVYTFLENTIPTYTDVSPVGLSSTSTLCTNCDVNISLAESNLQSILNKNLSEIQKLSSATLPLRNYRNSIELKAWSYLQSISYLRSEISNIDNNLDTLKSFDYNSL